MSKEWEQYRDQFAEDRLATYEAYVDVWSRDADTPRKFADWITFTQCADAELAKIRSAPDLVRQAEALMSRNGYRLATTVSGAARQWQYTRGEVRTNSSPNTRTAVKPAAKQRAARKATTPRVLGPKKPAPPPKAPPRPTHVECPNDPGMMVPLAGTCMCGWSPLDDN